MDWVSRHSLVQALGMRFSCAASRVWCFLRLVCHQERRSGEWRSLQIRIVCVTEGASDHLMKCHPAWGISSCFGVCNPCGNMPNCSTIILCICEPTCSHARVGRYISLWKTLPVRIIKIEWMKIYWPCCCCSCSGCCQGMWSCLLLVGDEEA